MSDVAINGNFIRLGDPTLSFHNFGTPAGAHVLESCSKGCVIACFYFTQSSYHALFRRTDLEYQQVLHSSFGDVGRFGAQARVF